MESAYLTIPQIIAFFNIKGFNEKDLGLDAKPGMIAEAIRNAYDVARASASSKHDVENYFLDLTGHFDGQKDTVRYRFDFYINNQTEKARVRALSAKMGEFRNEFKKLYLFADTRQMGHSNEIYAELSNIRTQKVLELNPQIIRQPTLHKSRHI